MGLGYFFPRESPVCPALIFASPFKDFVSVIQTTSDQPYCQLPTGLGRCGSVTTVETGDGMATLAVGEYGRPGRRSSVYLFDVTTLATQLGDADSDVHLPKIAMCERREHRVEIQTSGNVKGLAGLDGHLFDSPRVAVGGFGSYESTLSIFDANSGKILERFPDCPPSGTWKILWESQWPREMFVGGARGAMDVYDLTKGRKKVYTRRHTHHVTGLSSFVRHNAFFSVSLDASLVLWSRRTQHVEKSARVVGRSVVHMDKQRCVVVGTEKGSILIRDERDLLRDVSVLSAGPDHIVVDLQRVDDQRFVSVCGSEVSMWNFSGLERKWLPGCGLFFNACVLQDGDFGRAESIVLAEERVDCLNRLLSGDGSGPFAWEILYSCSCILQYSSDLKIFPSLCVQN